MGILVQFLQSIHIWPVLSVIVAALIFVYFERRKFGGRSNNKISVEASEELGAGSEEDSLEDSDITPSLEDVEHVPYKGVTVPLLGGAKKFYEIANDRRSIRTFSSKSVPFEVIEDCVRAAGTAPSGAHTEPWSFCVVTDPSMKSHIRAIVEAEELINYHQRMSRQWTSDLRPLKTNHIKEYLTTAPVLILVFKQTFGVRKDGKRKQHYYNEISTSIAVGILICALQAAGLNSLVTTPLNCGPALRVLLNRPTNEKLLFLMPVGVAADDCTVPDLKRKSLDEILVKY